MELTRIDDTTKQVYDALYMQYVDVIGTTVGAFVHRYGGHYDTLRADANMFFLLCCDKYRDAQNTPVFRTQLKRWVWFGLIDTYRTETGTRRQCTTKYVGDMGLHDPGTTDADHWWDGLTADEKTAVHLALDPPPCLATKARKRGGKPQNMRSTMREHLQACGWTNERVSGAFKGVADAL